MAKKWPAWMCNSAIHASQSCLSFPKKSRRIGDIKTDKESVPCDTLSFEIKRE